MFSCKICVGIVPFDVFERKERENNVCLVCLFDLGVGLKKCHSICIHIPY